jgi:hypothetical protein
MPACVSNFAGSFKANMAHRQACIENLDSYMSTLSQFSVCNVQGAISKVPMHATAFPHRDVYFSFHAGLKWKDDATAKYGLPRFAKMKKELQSHGLQHHVRSLPFLI